MYRMCAGGIVFAPIERISIRCEPGKAIELPRPQAMLRQVEPQGLSDLVDLHHGIGRETGQAWIVNVGHEIYI
jgi:hypothetical protein